jgi:hypothetical protein
MDKQQEIFAKSLELAIMMIGPSKKKFSVADTDAFLDEYLNLQVAIEKKIRQAHG